MADAVIQLHHEAYSKYQTYPHLKVKTPISQWVSNLKGLINLLRRKNKIKSYISYLLSHEKVPLQRLLLHDQPEDPLRNLLLRHQPEAVPPLEVATLIVYVDAFILLICCWTHNYGFFF